MRKQGSGLPGMLRAMPGAMRQIRVSNTEGAGWAVRATVK